MNNTKLYDMRKTYEVPETEVTRVRIETSFLIDSTHEGKSTVDFSIEDADDVNWS